jgi:chromosome segregation ATPase
MAVGKTGDLNHDAIVMERNQARAAKEAQQAAVRRVEELQREMADLRDGSHRERYDITEANASTRSSLHTANEELAKARGEIVALEDEINRLETAVFEAEEALEKEKTRSHSLKESARELAGVQHRQEKRDALVQLAELQAPSSREERLERRKKSRLERQESTLLALSLHGAEGPPGGVPDSWQELAAATGTVNPTALSCTAHC